MARIVVAVQFFPRGGSAHVVRALCRELQTRHDVTLVSGSRTDLGELGDATCFYRGVDDVRPVVFGTDAPMHGSYEPDNAPWVGEIDDAEYALHVDAWTAALGDACADAPDVLYLHHLTPVNEAAARVAPDARTVVHLHGTELLYLEDDDTGPYGEAWTRRMGAWADRADALCAGPGGVDRARELFGERDIASIPNGVDLSSFTPPPAPREHRRTRFLYVGRFTEVKRVPLLVRAHARAGRDSELVLVGGYPGEGEAPDLGDAGGVTLAGWKDHDELPPIMRDSDVIVLPSVREQFGQVLIEGMACGLPAIAVDAYGPATIIRHGETGLLVPPDDEAALASALATLADDRDLRRRMGAAAREDVAERYGWPAVAARVENLLCPSPPTPSTASRPTSPGSRSTGARPPTSSGDRAPSRTTSSQKRPHSSRGESEATARSGS